MIKVPPRGPRSAKIMVVGEAPGQYEEQDLKPFVGPSGRLLTEMLMKAGIDPEEVFYTNLCKYRPPENELKAWIKWGVPNEPVTEGLLELASEIQAVKPNVIIPLGNYPLYFLYGQKLSKQGHPTGILDYRGYVLEARKVGKGTKLVPSIHPSYYIRGKSGEAPLGVFDFRKAQRESHSPGIVRRPRTELVDPRGAEREDLRQRLLTEGRWVAVDIEYTGSSLKWVGFAVAEDWAVSIKIRGPEDMLFVRSIVESGRPLLMQNAMYDCGMFDWHWGIDAWKNLEFDTMVAAYNLNMEYKKDLGFLGSFYTDVPAWWDIVDWDKIRRGEQSIDEVGPYNCTDAYVTYEVAERQLPELSSDPKLVEAFKFDMRKLPALWEIAKRGVSIDVKRVQELTAKADDDQELAQSVVNHLADTFGVDRKGLDLNVDSPTDVPRLLFDGLGVPAGGYTPSKRWRKSDKVTLMEAMRKLPPEQTIQKKAIEYILLCRKARDVKSGFTEVEWDEDGRARCIYDPVKTGTRRLASKEFFPTGRGKNLQNIHAPGSSPEYGELVRSCFVPDSGRSFGYADLKGAEFLVVAELTQDPLMLKFARMTIEGTGSVHKETGSLMFDKPTDQISKDSSEYFLGKKFRHSGNYLVGARELTGRINAEALHTGVWVTEGQVKALLTKYTQDLHPLLPSWWREVEAEARQTGGKLRNLFGFPRIFHGAFKLPDMVAFIPQSTVGDCLNFGLLAAHADSELKDYGFEIFLQVHDAIGFQFLPGHEAAIASRLRTLMDVPIYIPKTDRYLHIPVEILYGPNWGSVHEYTEDLAHAA